MIPPSNDKIPVKSSLASGNKPSSNMSVRFETENTNTPDEKFRNKGLTRKQASESSIVHEIRAWSSLVRASANEQVLTDTNNHSSDSYASETSNNQSLQQVIVPRPSTSNQERSNRYRSALIDRNKRYGYRHDKLKWRSILGTMPEIYYILTYKRFFRGLSCLQTLVIFIDSCFRGIGQVMFANNPLSGLVSLKQSYL